MSVLGIMYLFITPFLLKRYAAKWTYYAWLIIIIGLIIPFRPEINMSLIEVNLPFASTENGAQMVAPGDDSFQSMEFQQARNGEEQQSIFHNGEAMEQGAIDANSVDEDVEGTNVYGEVPFYTTALQDNGAGEATTDHSVLTSNTEEQNKLITSIVGWTAIVFAIWLTGALSYLIYQLHTYRSFSRTVRRWSVLIEDVAITYVYRQLQKDMGITKNIPLKYSAIIDTPMLIGYVNPTIVLPRTNYQLNELRFVLTHELVHYKRKDMWVKALTMVATAMHWFNPLLYMISKAISSQCEISCDEAVVKRIDQNGRREYGEMILKTARDQHRKIQTTLTTNFYGGKKEMKKRLVSIMNVKKKKAGVVIMGSLLITTTLSGGVLAGVPSNANENTLQRTEITTSEQKMVKKDITVYDNGYKVELNDPIYFEQNSEIELFSFSDFILLLGDNAEWNEQTQTLKYERADGGIIEATLKDETLLMSNYPADPNAQGYRNKEEKLQRLDDKIYVSIKMLQNIRHVPQISWEDENIFLTDGIPALFDALYNNDVITFKQLLAQGQSADMHNPFNASPILLSAILNENIEIVKVLLDADADVNARSIQGMTALDQAISIGNKEIVDIIFASNPTFDEEDALFYVGAKAILDQDKQALLKFLNNNDDVNAKNKYGETLLNIAARWDKEAMEVFIEKGAEIDLQNDKGVTPLMSAASSGNIEAVQALMTKKANINLQNNDGDTALHVALNQESEDIALALVKAGAKVDIANNNGVYALHLATSMETTKLLIEKGSDVNATDKKGNTALHHAAGDGALEAVKVLLQSGADKNIQNAKGITPLIEATDRSELEVVQYLVTQGVNLDLQNGSNNSALHSAAMDVNVDIVKILVEGGANKDLQNNDKETPLILALQDEDEEIISYLIEQGVNMDLQDVQGETALTYAIMMENEEIIPSLIAAKANVNIKDVNGETAIFKTYDADTLTMLINAGATVDTQDNDGWTRLIHAARSGDEDIVKILLEAGADTTIQSASGETALDFANKKYYAGTDYTETIKLLEEAMK